MAYALMAGVPAINGLYVSFFTVILYVLFGTSRHLSTGNYSSSSWFYLIKIFKFRFMNIRNICDCELNGYFVN
jgi:MFS superfamily sulfate permease-like transporter